MKSAYELAMERLEKETPSGPPLGEETKKALAEIDNQYMSKIEEKRILAEQEKFQSAGDFQALEKIQARLGEDIRRLESARDKKKAEVRRSKTPE